MALADAVGFERAAEILDTSKRGPVPALKMRFPKYQVGSIPADGVRTRAGGEARAPTRGLLGEGSDLRREFEAAPAQLVRAIDAHSQGHGRQRMSFAPRFSITNGIAAALTDDRTGARVPRRGEPVGGMGERDAVGGVPARGAPYDHIEGTRLTIEQAADLLAGQAVPGADPDDARELLNYRDAFEFVGGYLNDGGPITERLILEIHRRLVVGVRGGAAAPGEYRRVQNYVVNATTGETMYTPPPAHDVAALMRELVGWVNRPSDIHPVIASAIVQFQLVHSHPFLDGNGRTSRLLSTLGLYRAGYDFKRLFTISEYYDRDRTAFYRALQSVRRADMDMTGWIEFFTQGLATQLAEVKQRGEHAMRRDVLARRHALTDRQVLALGHVWEHGRLTIGGFEDLCPGTPRRSLQRDLRVLVEKGQLVRRGRTNRLEYVPADGDA